MYYLLQLAYGVALFLLFPALFMDVFSFYFSFSYFAIIIFRGGGGGGALLMFTYNDK